MREILRTFRSPNSKIQLSFYKILHNCLKLHFLAIKNNVDLGLTFYVFNNSKDIYLVDEVIPRTLSSFLMTFFQTSATFVIIIYSTPWFAAVMVPMLILYYFIQVTLFVSVNIHNTKVMAKHLINNFESSFD